MHNHNTKMVALKCVYVGFLFSLCLSFTLSHIPDHLGQKLEDTHHVDGARKGIGSSSSSGSGSSGYRVGFGAGGSIPGWPGFGLGGSIGIGPGIGYGIGIGQASGSGRHSNRAGVPAPLVIQGNGHIGNGCTCTPACYQGTHKGGALARFNEEPYRGGTRTKETRDYVEASEPPNT